MPSGTPKFFTCRSVGSGTAGDLGGHYIHRRGAQVYRAGDCMPFPRSRGRRQMVTALSVL
jgi:hypothetical protein